MLQEYIFLEQLFLSGHILQYKYILQVILSLFHCIITLCLS